MSPTDLVFLYPFSPITFPHVLFARRVCQFLHISFLHFSHFKAVHVNTPNSQLVAVHSILHVDVDRSTVTTAFDRGVPITGARSTERMIFVQWRWTIVAPHCGN